MEQNYLVKGLKFLVDEGSERCFYYNDSMLENDILIEESTFMNENDVETLISVKHIHQAAGIDLNASDYTLYWDTLLAPIQVYRILKDVNALYNELTLNEFTDSMRELSTQFTSSSMQSDLKHGEDVMNRIKESFGFVEEYRMEV